MQDRPDWAPTDLEDVYCEALELICDREGISWQAFIERAAEKSPHLPLATTIRVEVTEYLRTVAGWLPDVAQPHAYALHELPSVGLVLSSARVGGRLRIGDEIPPKN
jgi:predicted DNA-binding ribbon-helix-helix protein